jgi:diphthamide biosynthesis protein 7
VALCEGIAADRVRVRTLATHALEAWTVAFTPGAGEVFSGGDDGVLQRSWVGGGGRGGGEGDDEVESEREQLDHDEGASIATQSQWQDRRLHGAGVTAIVALSDELVVSGSYDDHIRVLALPTGGRRQCLASLHLGGGVWRLKVLTGGLAAGLESDSADSASASASDSAATAALPETETETAAAAAVTFRCVSEGRKSPKSSPCPPTPRQDVAPQRRRDNQ